MKKIAIILMILSLAALCLTGCTAKPAEPVPTEKATEAPADATVPAEDTADANDLTVLPPAENAATAAPAVTAAPAGADAAA